MTSKKYGTYLTCVTRLCFASTITLVLALVELIRFEAIQSSSIKKICYIKNKVASSYIRQWKTSTPVRASICANQGHCSATAYPAVGLEAENAFLHASGQFEVGRCTSFNRHWMSADE
jgi:hypothetical protein